MIICNTIIFTSGLRLLYLTLYGSLEYVAMSQIYTELPYYLRCFVFFRLILALPKRSD